MDSNKNNGLIYALEDRPPLKDTLFAALQHLLSIFVAIITPPLIVSGALGFESRRQVILFLFRSLFQESQPSFSVADSDLSAADFYVFREQVFRLSAR